MGSPPHLQHMQQQQQQQQQMMGMNGGAQNVAMMKMMQQQHSVSRSGSPQMMAHHPHGQPGANEANAAMVMQQLNQMNNIHAMAHQMHHDLPPPPPIPAEQLSPPNVAPPPPPPPPPLLDSPPKKMMGNGDAGMANGGLGLQAQMSKVTLQKKILPPQQHTDTRSDLMKAIRDGECEFVFVVHAMIALSNRIFYFQVSN